MSGSLLQFHISRFQIPASLSCLFQTTFCFKSFINLLSFISFSPEIGLSVCFHPSFIHPRTFTLLVRWWRWLVFTANVNADHLLVSALNKHSFNNNALETEKPQRIARLLLLLSFLSVHPSVNYFFFFLSPSKYAPTVARFPWLAVSILLFPAVIHRRRHYFYFYIKCFYDCGEACFKQWSCHSVLPEKHHLNPMPTHSFSLPTPSFYVSPYFLRKV